MCFPDTEDDNKTKNVLSDKVYTICKSVTIAQIKNRQIWNVWYFKDGQSTSLSWRTDKLALKIYKFCCVFWILWMIFISFNDALLLLLKPESYSFKYTVYVNIFEDIHREGALWVLETVEPMHTTPNSQECIVWPCASNKLNCWCNFLEGRFYPGEFKTNKIKYSKYYTVMRAGSQVSLLAWMLAMGGTHESPWSPTSASIA